MPTLGRKIWKWIAALFAAVIILLALGVGLFRLIVPQVPGYRADVERWAGDALGLPVSIASVDLQWDWLGPEVVLGDVRVLGPQGQVVLVHAAEIQVGISLPALISTRTLRPSRIALIEPLLDVTRTDEGEWLLAGYPVGGGAPQTRDWRTLLQLMLVQGRAEVRGGRLRWSDATRTGWEFSAIDLTLKADKGEYVLHGSLQLPGALGEQLAFQFQATGAPAQPETWDWSGSLAGRDLRAQALYELMDAGDSRLNGLLTVFVQVTGNQGQLTQLNGGLQARNLSRVQPGPGLLGAAPEGRRIDELRLNFDWQRIDNGWELVLRDIGLQRGARMWPTASVRVNVLRQGDGARQMQMTADFLRLEDIALLASWLPDNDNLFAERLTVGAYRGDVRELEASYRDIAGEIDEYAIRAAFEGFGMSAHFGLPSISGLNGVVQATQESGKARLSSTGLRAEFPGLFRNPLYATALHGTLQWTRSPDDWRLQSDDIQLANQDIESVTAKLDYRIPDDGTASLIDLQAHYRNIDFANKGLYFPTGIMSDNLVDWLDTAIIGGRSPAGSLIARGPLDTFPWTDGGGLFEIRGSIENTVLEYAPEWPRIENIHGDLLFRGMSFTVTAARGEVLGMPILPSSAGMEDMQDGVLRARGGTTQVAAEQLAAFVRASPLAERFGAYLDVLGIEGPASATLDLVLPIKELDDTRIRADVTLGNARVAVQGLLEPFTRVSTVLQFTENGVTSDAFRARWLGRDVSGTVRHGVAGDTRIELQGRSAATAFAHALALQANGHVAGEADWRAVVRIPPPDAVEDGPLTVRVDSDLQGVAVSLPPPLHKASDDSRPVRAELAFTAADRLHLDVAYGADLHGWFELRNDPALRIHGGHIHFGEGRAAARDAPGIALTGMLGSFDLDAWRALEYKGGDELLREADVRIGEFAGFGQHIGDLQIQAAREADGWHVRLRSDPVNGAMLLPVDFTARPVALNMRRLWLSLPEEKSDVTRNDAAQKTPPDPRELPGVVLNADDFAAGLSRLGAVEARIVRQPNGLALEYFRASGATFEITASGAWEVADGQQQSRLNITLASHNVRQTLSSLGYNTGIEARDGKITAELRWPGSPIDDVLPRLNGGIGLRLANGQLREVAPGGAGRLFGLLSLGALPRRLLLDFSDVFSAGLSFDTASGDFVLESGNAYTRNLRLEGPAADILLVGRVGLAARDYDQVVLVEAGLSSALPVAGAIAGGPAVGAVVLLLSQLLKEPIKDVTQTRYWITGSWDNPTVEKLAAGQQPAVPESGAEEPRANEEDQSDAGDAG